MIIPHLRGILIAVMHYHCQKRLWFDDCKWNVNYDMLNNNCKKALGGVKVCGL